MNNIKELIKYFLQRKKWWILPILLFLLMVGLLLLLPTSGALAPFIYTLF